MKNGYPLYFFSKQQSVYFLASKRGACWSHYGLAIYIKRYPRAKEELWKLKYFTMQKLYNLQKNPLKKTNSFKIL
jgi:hypothetical protein